MARSLIIDDEKDLCEILFDMIIKLGHEADIALSLDEGLSKCRTEPYDIVFLDVRLPDGNGLEAMPAIRKLASDPEIVIITGYADPKGAELAIKNGAWDYIQKPISPKHILLPLQRVLQYCDQVKKLSKPMPALKLDEIIGDSSQMRTCCAMIAQAAASTANILITGETGTGKGLAAQAIHRNSPVAGKPFVVVDCAAIPKTLVESELFGNIKGAFTGAHRSRDGLVSKAHGGFLFLDEVGELPFSIQKSFLRVIEEHRFRPVGSNKEMTSEFRLVAATNRDLDHMVKKGLFRQDLLFRLCGISIELPPLRKRRDDIRQLASHYAARICREHHLPPKGMSPEFIDMLCAYDWPGNVRELINTLENAIHAGRDEEFLFGKHLPQAIRIKALQNNIVRHETPMPSGLFDNQLEKIEKEAYPTFHDFRESTVNNAEKHYLERLLVLTSGNIKESCLLAKLGRTRLYQLMKKHGFHHAR
jgi:two-component system, NtrC family, response regulator